MRYIVKTRFKPVDIALSIESSNINKLLRTVVYNPFTNDLIYERIDLPHTFNNAKRDVVLKLPVTPEKVIIETFNDSSGLRNVTNDGTFKTYNVKKMKLKSYNIDYGTGDKEFLSFIEKFAQDLPNIKPSDVIIKSPSGRFKLVLFDKLRGRDGTYVNSPAMIHVKTGLIEVSKQHFLKLSVNQRIATLCHEYAHFYKNPSAGYDVRDEYGADLHGLSVFLARGYGESEYLNAFRKTFNGHPTTQNRARWKLIQDFSKKIHSGQFFGKPYNL